MKEPSQVTAILIDYGYFVSLAEKLAETFQTVYYYSPFHSEYLDFNSCAIGDGLERVIRCDDFLSPEIFDEIDLFIFPDIGFDAMQRHIRSQGKAVWGAFDATNLELFRTEFLETIESLKLPSPKSVVLRGITELSDHLETVKDKWIKIDRYRGVMETWHHLDYQHSQRELERLSLTLGPGKEHVTFVVQDPIKTEVECGYDGWTVDGQFPVQSFQGYEHKNELYLGCRTRYTDLPKEIRRVNEAFTPLFRKVGYRNFVATEIRVKDEPYFIDPTFRMPGQSGEQLQESCGNLADVIWYGANGMLIEPKFIKKYAASATLHYNALPADQWRVMNIPKETRQFIKPTHYCYLDGAYQFPPSVKDEVAVILGIGNTITETLGHLKKNFESLSAEPVSANLDGFFDLLDWIKKAQRKGIKFTDDRIPDKKEILEYAT